MIVVKDLMTAIGSRASLENSLSQVIEMMRRNSHSCVVITEADRVVGIVTERDLVGVFARSLVNGKIQDSPLSVVMTPDPVCVSQHASLLDAIKLARANRLRHLPVVNEDNYLVGIVTHTDMINTYVDILEEQALLIDANTALRALSREDPLLQIGNRRAMEGDLLKTHAAAQRAMQPFAVALFDIDYFKRFNDHYGHLNGDQALQAVVSAITNTMRHGDTLYRYGGEELLMLMPNSDLAAAQIAAERARQAVQSLQLGHIQSPFNVLTISGGLASDNRISIDELIATADKALYQAKTVGRNRIVYGSDCKALAASES